MRQVAAPVKTKSGKIIKSLNKKIYMNSNPVVSNPNDFKVVSFHNSTDFGFTPDMGCMFDSRPINGKNGSPGIDAGETVVLPYHIGHQLALNLAKVAFTRSAPSVDPAGIPTGVPLWDVNKLTNLKNSYLKELYTEAKPAMVSETDKLMAKVEEYKKMVDNLVSSKAPEAPILTPEIPKSSELDNIVPPSAAVVAGKFQDKQEVIEELEKRGIPHDKRSSKDKLEKLLTP